MNASPGDAPDREIVDSSLTFFGRVTASVSHELNNVISIIDQTGGLLQDLIAGEERGVPISTERLAQAITSIRKQTDRGLQIIRRLNRFAHTADLPITEFEANETLDNLVALTRRLADLKRTQLDYKQSPAELSVTGNPFLLQQVLFGMIGLALVSAERGDIITIAVEGGGEKLTATIESPRRTDPDENAVAELQRVGERISGQLRIEQKDDSTAYNLTVPMRLPESG